jgi:tetratricopeptide (TPR) repeat protein
LYPDGPPDNIFQLGNAYHQKGMFHEAVNEYEQGFRRMRFPADKVAELRREFDRSGIKGFWQKLIQQLKTAPQREQDKWQMAAIYAALNDIDQTFEWLEKAYADRSLGLLNLKGCGFANLRSDPRYADLLRRIGLPQ